MNHDTLIQTIDRLCTVIETSIAEGSTIVACPVAVEARRLITPPAIQPGEEPGEEPERFDYFFTGPMGGGQ